MGDAGAWRALTTTIVSAAIICDRITSWHREVLAVTKAIGSRCCGHSTVSSTDIAAV